MILRKLAVVLAALVPVLGLEAGPVEIILPTDNVRIFSADPSQFYMYTDRLFEGVRSKPWTGGQYGYVRNQRRTSQGIVFTRFHEGIDIAPVRRDRAGRALDEVRAIGDGRVVHVNLESGKSSYGRYLVIEHDWGDGPVYSLYGHLEKIDVGGGKRVSRGHPIGLMGCTGWAGNRNIERSHLHLELNLLLHDRFPQWHNKHFTSQNHHGDFNGLNLVGLDIAGLYEGLRKGNAVSIPELVGKLSAYYKVAVPREGADLQILRRYPWLWKGVGGAGAASFEISLSRSGVPLRVEASSRKVSAPVVTWVQRSSQLHSHATRGRLSGMGSRASLSDSGKAYIELLSGRF